MVWGIRRDRYELIEELGKELVEWGEGIASVYDELPPDDGQVKPDDIPVQTSMPPAAKTTEPVETEFRDRRGRLMTCTICGARETVDGRFCRRHRGGY